jgi:aspartate ammonia-lyase
LAFKHKPGAAEAGPNSVQVATSQVVDLKAMATRREHDLLGEADVPAEALLGIHTRRALDNFPITGVPIGHFSDLVPGLVMVKQAAARANKRLGNLESEKAAATEAACNSIIAERSITAPSRAPRRARPDQVHP